MSTNTPMAPAGVAHAAGGGAGTARAGGLGVACPPVPGQEPGGVPAPPSPSPGTATAQGWPLGDYLAYAPHPAAVPCARLHAKQITWEWGLARLCGAVEQVVDELVANAITAAVTIPGSCPVGVWLLAGRQALLVMVWDASPHPPQPTTPGPDSEHGRGLLLVQHFSAQWGWYPTPGTGGKVTWALVTAETSAHASRGP